MKYILLTHKRYKHIYAVVDDEDYDRVISIGKWQLEITKDRTIRATATKTIRGKVFHYKMHRVVMNAPKGKLIDHIDGDGLDNRKENLRYANKRQNMWNAKPVKNSLGFIGVYKNKECKTRPYGTNIIINGKGKFLGYYKTPKEAQEAYVNARKKFQGEYLRKELQSL